MRYKVATNGEWIQPRRKSYYMQCCDCGLTHRLNFRLLSRGRGRGYKIQFQAFRLPKRHG